MKIFAFFVVMCVVTTVGSIAFVASYFTAPTAGWGFGAFLVTSAFLVGSALGYALGH